MRLTVEKNIRFTFLFCVPINICIQTTDIKPGIQIKQTSPRIVVLALCINAAVAILAGYLLGFLYQHMPDMLSAVFLAYLQVVQIHILKKSRLENCQSDALIFVVGPDKSVLGHGVIIILFIRETHIRDAFRIKTEQLV